MFILEGNIGAGKSTFLNLLAQKLSHITAVLEPIAQWQQDMHGQSLLANFYENPQRWAYALETFALQCRVQEHLRDQADSNPYRIFERSIFSGHHVFATNSYEQRFLTDLEWQLYNALFSMLTISCKAPLGFIYLRTSPEIAFKRLQKRQRSAESTISLEYLRTIHEKHEALIKNISNDHDNLLSKTPVVILDVQEDFETDTTAFDQHVEAIEKFINEQISPKKL